MNLSQIERQFERLQVKESHLRYFYNPACKKIPGVRQHVYVRDLEQDQDQDALVYGADSMPQFQVQAENTYADEELNTSLLNRTTRATARNATSLLRKRSLHT